MVKKKLVIFGTRHWKKRDMPIEIKDALELILAKVQPEVVLEEWSVTQIEESGRGSSERLPWNTVAKHRHNRRRRARDVRVRPCARFPEFGKYR